LGEEWDADHWSTKGNVAPGKLAQKKRRKIMLKVKILKCVYLYKASSHSRRVGGNSRTEEGFLGKSTTRFW